jgi:hypothetical protein
MQHWQIAPNSYSAAWLKTNNFDYLKAPFGMEACMYTHANGPDNLSKDGERRLKQLLEGESSNVIAMEHNNPAPAPEGVVCQNGVCSLGAWRPAKKAA